MSRVAKDQQEAGEVDVLVAEPQILTKARVLLAVSLA